MTQTAIAPQADQLAEASATPDPYVGETREAQALALYELIAQQPFFKGLNATHLHHLTDSALEMRFEPGQSIFAEGSPANRFYVILKGSVVLESELADRSVIPLQTLGPGDDLGWSWLFPPYFLHFSARALEPTTTILFYGIRLRDQCEQDHELGYQLMKRVAEVTTQRLRAMQQRLMEYIEKPGNYGGRH
jgi:CRP-like cAMP-binding protein